MERFAARTPDNAAEHTKKVVMATAQSISGDVFNQRTQ